jgi:hypothetical protein
MPSEVRLPCICTVTRATLGVVELYVMRRIGVPAYTTIAQEFVHNDGAGLSARTLQTRASHFGLTVP